VRLVVDIARRDCGHGLLSLCEQDFCWPELAREGTSTKQRKLSGLCRDGEPCFDQNWRGTSRSELSAGRGKSGVGAASARLASTAGVRGCWMARVIIGSISEPSAFVCRCATAANCGCRYGAAAFAIMSRRGSHQPLSEPSGNLNLQVCTQSDRSLNP